MKQKRTSLKKTSYDTSCGSSYADPWNRSYKGISAGQDWENQHDQGWKEDTCSTRGGAGLYEKPKSQTPLMGGICHE